MHDSIKTQVAAAKAAVVKRITPAAPAREAPAETAEATVARRGRGRPLGAKNKPKVAPKVAAARIAAPKPVAVPVAAKPLAVKLRAAEPKTVLPKIITKIVAPLAVATPSKGTKTMNDTITTIQDTAKKFTGEASARAKGAYEKSVKLTEELTEFQKGNVEAVVESSKLAAKAIETLGQEAADYARKSFEQGTAAFKTFASAKSPTELFKLQSDYMKSYFESAAAEGSKVTEAWLKIAGEVTQPLSNRMAIAVDKVKVAASF